MNQITFSNKPCVYLITHVPSGRFYIGSAGKVTARFSDHIRTLKEGSHHNVAFQSIFDGEENLSLDYWECDTRAAAYEEEQLLLSKQRTNPLLLNSNIRSGSKSTEDLNHISEVMRNRPQETKDLCTAALRLHQTRGEHWIGKKHRSETIEKMKDKSRHTEAKKAQIEGVIDRNGKKVSADGVIYRTASEAARKYGVNQSTIVWRCKSTNPQYCSFFFV